MKDSKIDYKGSYIQASKTIAVVVLVFFIMAILYYLFHEELLIAFYLTISALIYFPFTMMVVAMAENVLIVKSKAQKD